jgi:hypothetical protein
MQSEVFERQDLESAIQQLRAHLEAAIERDSPRPVIEALSATIEELEAGRLPHRHARSTSVNRG